MFVISDLTTSILIVDSYKHVFPLAYISLLNIECYPTALTGGSITTFANSLRSYIDKHVPRHENNNKTEGYLEIQVSIENSKCLFLAFIRKINGTIRVQLEIKNNIDETKQHSELLK